MLIVLSEQGKNEDIFVCECSSRSDLNQEYFNNQVNKITCVATTQLLSPDTPVTARRVHEHKGGGGRDGDDAKELAA